MKKYISILLSFLMLLTMLPLEVFASEDTISEHDELIALACDVFPEYASEIRGEITNYATPASVNPNEVVFSETRKVSNTQDLGITQFASGQIIVCSSNYDWASITVPNSSTSDISTVGLTGTATFKVTASDSFSGTFTLSNVKYTIYYTGSDYFTNTGTYSTNKCQIGTTSLSSTYINYPLTFQRSGYCTFELYFDNNQLVAEVR